ncbi:Uncharacterised protein [Klebsiella pneumoniae]|nr:Uncharacterised protein [Klebsiella pneumoniae]
MATEQHLRQQLAAAYRLAALFQLLHLARYLNQLPPAT